MRVGLRYDITDGEHDGHIAEVIEIEEATATYSVTPDGAEPVVGSPRWVRVRCSCAEEWWWSE